MMGERRSTDRIAVKDLPELLKRFEVDLGTGQLVNADTVDASISGISLLVPIHIYEIKNYDIILHTVDNSFILEEEIVYIKGIDPKQSRISIMFSSDSPGYKKYCELLNFVQ